VRFTDAHKVITTVALCAAFSLSCMQPTDSEVQAVAEQPAPDAPQEPVSSPEIPDNSEPQGFQPAKGTVYILDADDGIYLQDTVDDPALFRAKCSAWRGAVESYNRKRNKPGPYPYRFVAGEAP